MKSEPNAPVPNLSYKQYRMGHQSSSLIIKQKAQNRQEKEIGLRQLAERQLGEWDNYVINSRMEDNWVATTISGFFCKDYIGSNAQTWKNLTQDAGSRYIIIKLKSDDLIDLERASKICRQCHDAQVISHLDASKLSHTLFPAWINVTARISGSSDKTKNVTWTDYASLGNFTNNDIEWIHWLSNQSHIYALLAIPPSRDSDIRRWAALPQEKSYYDPATRQISMDIFVVKSAICQRPIRKSCHYWITEGERCVFHTKFGCHTYIDFMSQAPDDADNGNVCSKARRTVKR
uniref:Uncharacterized protein n=1 Tax=Romanomermis culicivorax TaxID=13658 RepID=A0A915JHU5_ROMCU